jgi:phage baseplate assembly protein W
MKEKYVLRFEDGVTESAELAREVHVLLSTRRGSAPINREFGIDWGVLDEPIGEVPSDLMVQIMEQLEKFIPSLKCQKIECEFDAEKGKIVPTITLGRNMAYDG